MSTRSTASDRARSSPAGTSSPDVPSCTTVWRPPTRVGGLQTVVQHGESGLLVPPGDDRALADAIERVLTDHRLRVHLAHGARERAELFTWSRVGDGIEMLYQRVLAEHQPVRV